MLATQERPVKTGGYQSGALDRLVFEWATNLWPDVGSDWHDHRDYYLREYVKSMRYQVREGRCR